jgi:phospholipase D1/2
MDNERFTLKDRIRHLKNFGDQSEFAFKTFDKRVTVSSMFSNTVQVLRSAGHWSLGLKSEHTENSIYIAYMELIDKARHFIYIENQFFISDTAGDPIKNKIAQALILRVRRAIEEGKNFKVVIIIPLLPGFEGGVEEKSGTFTRLALNYQQNTISRGANSLYSQ